MSDISHRHISVTDHVKVRHPGYEASSFCMVHAMIEKATYTGASPDFNVSALHSLYDRGSGSQHSHGALW